MLPAVVAIAGLWLVLPTEVRCSLFFSAPFSPSPTNTNVGEFRLFAHPNLEVLDEVNDDEIFMSVVHSMRDYAIHREKLKRRRRWKRDEEVICYKELGCFRDSGPFDYLDMLPSPPEEIGTAFMLYGRHSPDLPQTVSYTADSLEFPAYNGSLPTKIIIHGFGSSCNRVWAHEMRQALLTTLDCNVICVNWDKGAATPNYMRASVNTRLVGRQVAILIKQLVKRYKTSLDDIHLIGFSLGAHVSGYAGQELGGNISRITGLDPAGPLFEGYSLSARLDASDAQFVDVIHSNGDSLLKGGLGTWEQLGHVDFYPNGGRMQKGCTNLFLGAVSDLIWSGPGDGRSLCNHRRSYRFFIDSISPLCTFPAVPCDSYESLLAGDCFPCGGATACGNMGYYADRSSARGKLYLITRDEEPFCANQHRVTVNGQKGVEGHTYGRLDITLISSSGINETFPLTNGDGVELSRPLVRILVAHPAIRHIAQVQLRYTAYHGWLYTGAETFTIDKVAIVNSFGSSTSYCQRNMVLPSGKPVVLNLRPGNCRSSSFRPNQSFWKPPPLPPASVAETIPEPPPLDELTSNHVRSFNTDGGRPFGGQPPRRRWRPAHGPPTTAGSFARDERPDEPIGGARPDGGEPRTPPADGESAGSEARHAAAGKPVRGPDDLGVIVIQGVREDGVDDDRRGPGGHRHTDDDRRGSDGARYADDHAGSDSRRHGDDAAAGAGADRQSTLAQLARVVARTNSTAGRRGKAVAQPLAHRAAARRPRANSTTPHHGWRQRRPGQPPPPAEPVYYVQYLPPELFDRPTADYIASSAAVPHPAARPPQAARLSRGRSLRFNFLRHLFSSWETRDETRYIPLHEGRREPFRNG